MDVLIADIRYALRTLARSPGFATVAILSLALGIGANTLVFSVINAVVFKPLPIARPDRVFFLQGGGNRTSWSFPNYRDLRDRNVALDGLIGFRPSPMNIEARGAASRAWGYLATGNYFDVLGVKPAAGRFFHQEDDRVAGQSAVAVLSYDGWIGRFGGDPGIVGSTIRINNQPYTILGVAPRGFYGTELFYRPEIWVPMMMQAQIEVGNPWLETRATANTWVACRLKDGVSVAQAESNLNAIAADLAREYPAVNDKMHFSLAYPGMLGDALGAPVKAFTAGVLVLAALVLIVACANLASLLTARGTDRQRELAIRAAIGAGRGRIVRQLVTETLLLALIGGAAGSALAVVVARALSAFRFPTDVPVQIDVSVDLRVLLFCIGVSIAAGLLFGIAPARQAARTDPNAAIKGVQTSGPVRRVAFRDVLIALQVALSFVLVSACLLSLRGLQQAITMPLGFDADHVAVAGFEMGLSSYTRDDADRFRQRVVDAVAALPGVTSVGYGNSFPLSIDQSNSVVFAENRPMPRPSEMASASVYEVSPGYFDALGMRILAGRAIERRDVRDRPSVAVVNETFARTVLGTTDAIGKRFFWGWNRTNPIEVVGVVSDGKYVALTERPRPAVFQSILQRYNTTTTLVVRSPRPVEEVVAEVRATIASLDPTMPLYMTGSLHQMLGLALFPSRAAAIALSAFGLLAIVLSATGIHGVVAYAVARRQRELGIRIAIGASRWALLRLVFARTAALVAIGAVAGLLLALAAATVLASVVYEAAPRDPAVFVAVALTMAAIGIVAGWGPARRSLRVNPVAALRAD